MENVIRLPFSSNARMFDNVEWVHYDEFGNPKPIFQEHSLGQWLIKKGYVSPLWINRWYAPLLTPFMGYWSLKKTVKNGITNAGRAIVSGLINGSGSPAAFTYIAVGTGTNAFNATDVALQTESSTSGLSRAAGSVSTVTTSVTNDTAQVTKTFSVTGTVAVTESGLFNASSSVTLLCRQTFSAINVVNTDSLQITWKVQNT